MQKRPGCGLALKLFKLNGLIPFHFVLSLECFFGSDPSVPKPSHSKAKGFSVYDVPADMVGIEALLGAGQRLDPRLSHKAVSEAAGWWHVWWTNSPAKNHGSICQSSISEGLFWEGPNRKNTGYLETSSTWSISEADPNIVFQICRAARSASFL